jgi:hypothetical protein
VTYTTVASGAFVRTDDFRLNRVPLQGVPGGVRWVRLIARSTQETSLGITDFGSLSMSEFQVFGHPANEGSP